MDFKIVKTEDMQDKRSQIGDEIIRGVHGSGGKDLSLLHIERD